MTPILLNAWAFYWTLVLGASALAAIYNRNNDNNRPAGA